MPTFDPPPIPLARAAASIRVVRYDPDPDADPFFTDLPNVRCLMIQKRSGPEPGVARFRYVFDQLLGTDFPQRVEDVISLDAAGRYVVRQDDRLCVLKDDVDGGYTILFDGYAQAPQADLSGAGESVTFQAQGVAVREWDTPLGGAYYRDADAPTTVSDVLTGLPTRFNPDGKPNCIPDGAGNMAGTAPDKYPTFLDVNAKKTTDVRTKWTVSKAARYIVGVGNPTSEYVDAPPFEDLDSLLTARKPVDGDFFDPDDDTTYTEEPIVCQDFDATGEAWPDALTKLIEPHGFEIVFRIAATSAGRPHTYCDVCRRDGGDKVKPKWLYLPAVGSTLDPGAVNLGSLSISRDTTGIVNRFVLDSEPVRYEADFVLAPFFAVAGGDATAVNPFGIGAAAFMDPTLLNADKYRVFIFDETGEGHWNFDSSSTVTTVPSLDGVLGAPVVDPVTKVSTRQYAKRRRPGIRELVTTDYTGKPLDAILWVSTDYAGAKPGVWDGTGTWQRVQSTEWELLKDRLGIKLTMRNPDDWTIGKPTDASPAFPSGKVRVVKSLASPDTANPRFHFRLTCVIEGDQDLTAVAGWRGASATKYQITRRADARDRFRKRVVIAGSYFNSDDEDILKVNDTDDAQGYVDALRTAHEAAKFAGAPEIPRLTLAYKLGDKIKGVKGREISFATAIGHEQGEGSRYPSVVGITWSFDGGQRTALHLEDRRAEPPARRSK